MRRGRVGRRAADRTRSGMVSGAIEDPPNGGPLAGIDAGRALRASATTSVVVVPGSTLPVWALPVLLEPALGEVEGAYRAWRDPA